MIVRVQVPFPAASDSDPNLLSIVPIGGSFGFVLSLGYREKNKKMINNIQCDKKNSRLNLYAKTSLILSLIPITVVLLGFLFCLFISGGSLSDNDAGAVWWLFVFLLFILIPIAPVIIIIALILSIMGLKSEQKKFAKLSMISIVFQIVVTLILLFILTIY